MKKVFATFLLLSLVCTANVTAFASDTVTENGGSASTTVTGSYKGQSSGEKIYSVDIEWTSLNFTYKADAKWDAATHTYTVPAGAGWEEGTGTITLTNHSNTAVRAAASYEAKSGFETADMDFSGNGVSGNALTLLTADNGQDGSAGIPTTGAITVTPKGSLPKDTTDAAIGTITVTISEAE